MWWPFKQRQKYPARVEFEARTPLPDETVAKHVQHALSLGLPEADAEPLPLLKVIANGPSAAQAPLDGPTLSLNGSIGLFKDTGPMFWAACDPQALVAEFLTNPPTNTVYMVASKCHPDVFDALKGRDVRIWHPTDYSAPPGRRQCRHATTITLTAPALFRNLGWRRFEFWGWDACMLDGKHHAVERGKLADDVTVTVKGRKFKSRQAWALEAQEAAFILQLADYDWTIKGDGLIRAYIEALDIKPIGALSQDGAPQQADASIDRRDCRQAV